MWGSAPLPRAQGLLSPLLLSRNLLLKMVVLGLLCYQWLSRRVICSDEEVGAGQRCGAMWGQALPSRAGWGRATRAVPGPGSVEQSQGCRASTVRGLAARGLLGGTAGTTGGERGSQPGRDTPKLGQPGRGVWERKRPPSPSQPMGEPWQGRNLPVCLVPPVFVSPVLGDVCRAGPVSLHGDGLRVHPAGHHLWGAGLEVTCPGRGPPQHGPTLLLGRLCSHQRVKTGCPASCSGCQSRAPLVPQADLREETEE